jgi:hypothetical protein
LPPLRERKRDILLLAEHFLGRACVDFGLPAKTLAPDASTALVAYRWPGNVRELINTMERVTLLAEAPVVTADLLGLSDRGPSPATADATPGRPAPHTDHGGGPGRAGSSAEALEATRWNVSRAAARLGISRNTIRYRIESTDSEPALRPARRSRQGASLPVPPAASTRAAAGRGRAAPGRDSLGATASGGAPGETRARPGRRPARHRARDRRAPRSGPVLRRPRRGAGRQRFRRALRTRADGGPGAPGGPGGARHAAGRRSHLGWPGPKATHRHRPGVVPPRASAGRLDGGCGGQAGAGGRGGRCSRARSPGRSSSAARARPSWRGDSICSRSARRPAAGRDSVSTASNAPRPPAAAGRASSGATTSSTCSGAGWPRRSGARARWSRSPARRASASRA